MYLVILRWFVENVKDDICVVTNTEEKAQEWIDNRMKGVKYSKMGEIKTSPIFTIDKQKIL